MATSDSDSVATRGQRVARKKHVGKNKFTQSTKEYKLLKRMFEKGDVAPTDKPADVCLRLPDFQCYMVTQFHSQFNKLKGIVGCVIKAGTSKTLLALKKKMLLHCLTTEMSNLHINEGMHKMSNKADEETLELITQAEVPKVVNIGEEDEESMKPEEEATAWVPKNLMTMWTNKEGVNFVSLILLLTGGAAAINSNGVELKVGGDGLELVISEVWSAFMESIDNFYSLFPKAADETDDEFNRRKYAMEDHVRAMKDGSSKLVSIYKKTLPFHVDPSTMKTCISTADGCRFCHVDLAEKQKVEVNNVIMMDTKKLPVSAEKIRSYSSLG